MGEKPKKTKDSDFEEDIKDILPQKKKGILPSIFSKKEKEDKPIEPISPEIKVQSSKSFSFANGKSARNIPEMVDVMNSLSDISLKKHVNSKTHEIADWIRKNYNNHSLADRLLKARNRKKIIGILNQHISDSEEIPSFEEEEEPIKKFRKIEVPKPSDKKNEPPKSPENLGGELSDVLPSLDDDLVPPEPTKDMLVSKKKLPSIGKILKKPTIKQHKEIDRLITLEEESKRMSKKKNSISKKEKILREKESSLASGGEANRREEDRLYAIKQMMDHDARERLSNLRVKDEDLREKESRLLEQEKKLNEKDKILDKLRERYLEAISKEEEFEKKESNLVYMENHLKEAKEELSKLQESIEKRFDEIQKIRMEIDSEWKESVAKFESINSIMEMKEKEIHPQLINFEKDISMFIKKEKIADKKFLDSEQNLKDASSKLKESQKHSSEISRKEELLRKEEEDISSRKQALVENEKVFSQKQKQLEHSLAKIEKNRLLKESTQKLSAELRSLESKLKIRSKELLDISKREYEVKKLKKELQEKKIAASRREKSLAEEQSLITEKQRIYEKQMEDMMDEKFHSYIKNAISSAQESSPAQPHDYVYKHNQIYILIDNCNELINMRKIPEARQLYNKIRGIFIGLDLKTAEYEMLRGTLQELYRKISLSSAR